VIPFFDFKSRLLSLLAMYFLVFEACSMCFKDYTVVLVYVMERKQCLP